MNTSFGLAAATALVLGAISISPASAHGGHHHGGHHHGGPHGHHHRGHGGHHHHGGGGHHSHRGGGWHGSHWHGPHWGGRPIIVRGGPRRVLVAGAYPVYGRPAGYGPGCTTTRRVGPTPWGWHKVVTTRTCLVP